MVTFQNIYQTTKIKYVRTYFASAFLDAIAAYDMTLGF